jgi:hypothetical protein
MKVECKKVCCCDATASSCIAKVQGKVFSHFQAVAVKVTVVCAYQDECFVNNPLDVKVKETDEQSMFLP